MKPCRTVTEAIAIAVIAGLVGGVLSGGVMWIIAEPWASITLTVSTLAIGFFTLLAKYPRWEADL